MPHHLLDLSLLLQIIQRLPRQTPVNLQPIDQRRYRDQAIRLHVFVKFVGGGFVEDDGVVGFVFNCLEGDLSVRLLQIAEVMPALFGGERSVQ